MKRLRGKFSCALLTAALVLAGQAAAQSLRLQDSAVSLGDALLLSLRQSPNVLQSAQQVESTRGSALQAQGGFDTVTEFSTNRTRNRIPLTASERATLTAARFDDITRHDSSQFVTRFALQKPLQNGLTLGTDYTVQRNADALQGLQAGPLGLPQSTGRLTFSLQVPLLRNAGRYVAGAQVDAAEHELAAAIASLEFASSQTVLSATLYYWDFVAKQRLLELAKESEGRTGRLLEEMRKLAAADQIPRSDLELVQASSAEKTAYRVSAEQALVASRRTLARHLGLSGVDEWRIERPSTPFPVADARALEVSKTLGTRAEESAPLRADLRAAQLREQSARIMRGAAQHNLKPQANLSFNVSEGGLALGVPSTALGSPFQTNRTGPSFTVGLQMQWPVENQQARGLLLARAASAVSAEITRRDLQSAVASGIRIAVSALNASAAQLESASIAVRHYAKTLGNEQTKRRMGAGTLIDVINVEDRLNGAQQTEVQVRQAYAAAAAQLLYESGRIVRKRDENEFDVPVDALLRLTMETAGIAER